MSHASPRNLKQVDERDILSCPKEILLLSKIRNEIMRLPYFLKHYRDLGVNKFLFVDDHSGDGTLPFLLSQPDCHVFRPDNNYSEAKGGLEWENAILDTYGVGYWTVVVDADELLVFPHCERASLVDLCAYLDETGASALFGFMLDLYPNGDLSKAVFRTDVPFHEICDQFDKDYVFCQRPLLRFSKLKFPGMDVIGGPRWREFYNSLPDDTLPRQIMNRLAWKISGLISRLGLKFDVPHKPPALFKIPLVKWHEGNARLSAHHMTNTVKLSELTCVLLHFKFFADFHARAVEEVKRGQMYAGGGEYRRYLKKISRNPAMNFMYEGSQKYTSSEDLLKFGLMRSTKEWDRISSTLSLRMEK